MNREVELHLRRFFHGHDCSVVRAPGRVETLLPEFRVMVLGPRPRTGLWTYASLGASGVKTGDHACEFFVLAPEANDRHVELIAMVAYYHATPTPTCRLGLGHTVRIGRPWLPGATCWNFLISLPYPFGPELELCRVTDGTVQILWLLPITGEELRFRKENGLEALEQRFEAAAIEYWKPRRKSVVRRSTKEEAPGRA